MNIPGIIKIEYIAKSNVSIASYASSYCTADNFTSTFTEIEFVPTTGGFTSAQQRTNAGTQFTNTLQFFVPKPDSVQKDELVKLSGAGHVYRVTDPQNKKYIIGDQGIPARLTFTEQVDPTYTGRRGYAVTVSNIDLHGALEYIETSESS